jgi:predicted DNA binding CopG/RHH family protein
MKKKIPNFRTDKAAERFVDSADLSEYDLSGFKLTRFEFEKKRGQLNMRLPLSLLEAVKRRAKARGIPYTRFVREAMERALAEPMGRRGKQAAE